MNKKNQGYVLWTFLQVAKRQPTLSYKNEERKKSDNKPFTVSFSNRLSSGYIKKRKKDAKKQIEIEINFLLLAI